MGQAQKKEEATSLPNWADPGSGVCAAYFGLALGARWRRGPGHVAGPRQLLGPGRGVNAATGSEPIPIPPRVARRRRWMVQRRGEIGNETRRLEGGDHRRIQ